MEAKIMKLSLTESVKQQRLKIMKQMKVIIINENSLHLEKKLSSGNKITRTVFPQNLAAP